MVCANGSFMKRIALQLLRSVLIDFEDFHAFNIEGTIGPCVHARAQQYKLFNMGKLLGNQMIKVNGAAGDEIHHCLVARFDTSWINGRRTGNLCFEPQWKQR